VYGKVFRHNSVHPLRIFQSRDATYDVPHHVECVDMGVFSHPLRIPRIQALGRVEQYGSGPRVKIPREMVCPCPPETMARQHKIRELGAQGRGKGQCIPLVREISLENGEAVGYGGYVWGENPPETQDGGYTRYPVDHTPLPTPFPQEHVPVWGHGIRLVTVGLFINPQAGFYYGVVGEFLDRFHTGDVLLVELNVLENVSHLVFEKYEFCVVIERAFQKDSTARMSTLGDFRAKKIAEILDGFTSIESEGVEEATYWPMWDFKRNQRFLVPMGAAANIFQDLCRGISEGVVDQNGEPLYYFGEQYGNTRPLRIEFEGLVKAEFIESDEDNFPMIYKTLVSAMVMALERCFEKTETGMEYRACCITYSTEQESEQFDIVIHFPYCRMKTQDFRDIYMPAFYNLSNTSLHQNLFSAFVGVDRMEDLVSQNTFSDRVPFFGCVRESTSLPKNRMEKWYIEEIPQSMDKVMEADIAETQENIIDPSKHLLFENSHAIRPRTQADVLRWMPLIFTNNLCKQRVYPLVRAPGAKPSFGNRESPMMRKVNARRQNRDNTERREKDIITDVVRHLIDTDDDYQSISVDKRNAIVKFLKYGMYPTELQELIDVVAEKESKTWFDIKNIMHEPPIRVGPNGFYLSFDRLGFILDHLDPTRCETTSILEDIACIICTMARTYEEKEEARYLFIQFVKKNTRVFRERGGEKGVEEVYFRQIKRAAKGRLTFWSIINMFEEDDPFYYHIWWQYICDYYILHSLDSEMATFPVARAASLPLIGKYAHTTGDAKPTWWKYTGTMWKNVHDTQSIELELTTSFIKHIHSVETRYPGMVERLSSKKVSFNILRNKLHEAMFRTGIVRDMSNVFLRDNRLLKFSNGNDPEYADFWASINFVYQYSDGEMKRRRGHWEDFLTKTFDVIDEMIPLTDPRCQFIISWVHKMLRDPATEHEFLKEISSFIRGFNREKRFSVWYGHGNGGKSKFMDLVSSTLGLVDGHAVKFPLETLLDGAKKSAGAASPEVDQARCAFLGVLDEPKKGMKFDAGKIKAITGNDPMYSRTLFSKGGAFRPMFKTVMLGNVLPKADYDMAMKIRFWVWWFKGRFAERHECPATEEEQERIGVYPLDMDLDTKLPEYKPAMLAVLLHYFKIYCKEGIRRTEGIRKATDMFWNSANDVLCFLSEMTRKVESVEPVYIPTDELYDNFRRWFMKRNNGERVMTNILFTEELQAIFTEQDIKAQGGVENVRMKDGA
jgi:hypothetical protein